MTKIKLGDLFALNTPKGKAYLHYIDHREGLGTLIRVLPGLYETTPNDLDGIASQPERFITFFPLDAAYSRKIVDLVGSYPATNFHMPEFMRSKHVIPARNINGWHIVNTTTWYRIFVEKLSPKEKLLSPWGSINDTLLIEWLVEDWSLDKWE